MYIDYCSQDEFKISAKLNGMLGTYFAKTVEVLKQPENVWVCVNFVDKDEIARINKQMRNLDRPTDVLSFPATDIKPKQKISMKKFAKQTEIDENGIFVGEMAICDGIASLQAKMYRETQNEEIARLFVHSLLHLFGYDHIKDEDYEVMHKLEKEILQDKCID